MKEKGVNKPQAYYPTMNAYLGGPPENLILLTDVN